ncbi:hypothetical protein CY652_06150 [Burkholderia sp. WAC0059]|uniref:pilus assembly protein TadG-related protein n=1 Tax=Burkholderia sp. WAC0059 TaxID=2066022 RepID=UPI000C7F013C|nr:pilus assembly protein TadG-related protein [Burkholderia sp. WAC0059]PLZ03384.1 hypothetical protein CY652_06150 [Burkholderia sp. WAC0059]
MPIPDKTRAGLMLRPKSKERGVSSIMLLILLIPIILIVGISVDFARMVQFRSDLQNAVDEAALAGAVVFDDQTQADNAQSVAQNYFNHAILPSSLSVASSKVTTDTNGTINPNLGGAAAHTVTVSATAHASTTLMSLFLPGAQTISAQGTAGNPIVSATPVVTQVNSRACDGNTVYLYQVPVNAQGTAYDFSSVPAFSNSSYDEIGTSYTPGTPQYPTQSGQGVPSFAATQPFGVMLRNDTNGNVGNPTCSVSVNGANSYGAPNGGSQTFYSSLLQNGESPSEDSNYGYQVAVTSGTDSSGNPEITSVQTTLPPSILNPQGSTASLSQSTLQSLQASGYNTLDTYLGINAPDTGYSNCTTSTSGNTTTYDCSTQYRTSKNPQTSATPNCSLYIQTGVTQDYINGLSGSSPPPSQGNCFSTTDGGAQYAAPSCAQLSALAAGSGSSATAPAAVFWWDDGGGVGPNEQFYLGAYHCAQMSKDSPGYGEDCQFQNAFFAIECSIPNGSQTGLISVVLTQ